MFSFQSDKWRIVYSGPVTKYKFFFSFIWMKNVSSVPIFWMERNFLHFLLSPQNFSKHRVYRNGLSLSKARPIKSHTFHALSDFERERNKQRERWERDRNKEREKQREREMKRQRNKERERKRERDGSVTIVADTHTTFVRVL